MMEEQLKATTAYISSRIDAYAASKGVRLVDLSLGVICGSGLGGLVDCFDTNTPPLLIPYKEIPHFPISSVPGHEGVLAIGAIGGKSAIILKGRLHCYEGHSPAKTVYPVQVLAMLGCKNLIVTNAAGGLNPNFNIGDFMIISDHVSLAGFGGMNPLVGPNLDFLGPRFPPTSDAYPFRLRLLAARTANTLNITLREGIYVYVSGPSFETRAEARFLRDACKADAVGMSTVPEVVCARHCGIKVLGLSLITNKVAVGYTKSALTEASSASSFEDEEELASHAEVLETSQKRALVFTELVKRIIIDMDV